MSKMESDKLRLVNLSSATLLQSFYLAEKKKDIISDIMAKGVCVWGGLSI